jgi:hypothetical protein
MKDFGTILAEIGLVYIHLADKEGASRVDIPMQSVYDFFPRGILYTIYKSYIWSFQAYYSSFKNSVPLSLQAFLKYHFALRILNLLCVLGELLSRWKYTSNRITRLEKCVIVDTK